MSTPSVPARGGVRWSFRALLNGGPVTGIDLSRVPTLFSFFNKNVSSQKNVRHVQVILDRPTFDLADFADVVLLYR